MEHRQDQKNALSKKRNDVQEISEPESTLTEPTVLLHAKVTYAKNLIHKKGNEPL